MSRTPLRLCGAAAALLLLAAPALAARSSATSDKAFTLLVVREDCWADFFTDFTWLSLGEWTRPGSHLVDCVTASVVKGLGFGIIAGSTLVKVPQLVNIVTAGSAEGLSASSQYQELVSNVLGSVWHIWNGSPFSAFGECITVSLGTLAVVLAMWRYAWPGTGQVVAVSALTALCAQLALTSHAQLAAAAAPYAGAWLTPAVAKDGLQFLGSLTFWGSRLTQIYATWAAGSTGTLAFFTLFANFAGTSARVLTSAKEVKDRTQLAVTAFNAFLNGVLLVQYFLYRGSKKAAGGKKGAKKAAPAPVSARKAAVAESPAGARRSPRVNKTD